jgi:hypothetical protein
MPALLFGIGEFLGLRSICPCVFVIADSSLGDRAIRVRAHKFGIEANSLREILDGLLVLFFSAKDDAAVV